MSARSKPARARGPVPIETQKQVPPGSVQLTATIERIGSTRNAYLGSGYAPSPKTRSCDLDGSQIACPDTDEGVALRRGSIRVRSSTVNPSLDLVPRHSSSRGGDRKRRQD